MKKFITNPRNIAFVLMALGAVSLVVAIRDKNILAAVWIYISLVFCWAWHAMYRCYVRMRDVNMSIIKEAESLIDQVESQFK